MAKLRLPDFGDIHVAVLEFAPNQGTIDRFDPDPSVLWRACKAWLEYVHNPPSDPPKRDHDFDFLTGAIQLRASLHRHASQESYDPG